MVRCASGHDHGMGFVDLAGTVVENILVEECLGRRNSPGNKNVLWRCRCLVCGGGAVFRADSLKAKRPGAGCRNCSYKMGGIYRTSRTPPEEILLGQIRTGYERAAKRRGLVFQISDSEFLGLIKQDCYYCGGQPENKQILYRGPGDEILVYNGLDRIDNAIGYTTSNVVSCCFSCNASKGEKSVPEFLFWIRAVYEHTKEW